MFVDGVHYVWCLIVSIMVVDWVCMVVNCASIVSMVVIWCLFFFIVGYVYVILNRAWLVFNGVLDGCLMECCEVFVWLLTALHGILFSMVKTAVGGLWGFCKSGCSLPVLFLTRWF